MQAPSFESPISPPWADSEETDEQAEPYHLANHQAANSAKDDQENALEPIAIPGYN